MVCILLFGIFGLSVSIAFAGFYLIFSRFEKLTGKTYAKLTKTKHMGNVRVTDRLSRRSWIEKHYTKSIHIYTVNNRSYKIRDSHFSTPKKVASSIKIIYIKMFPMLHYIDDPYHLGKDGYSLISILLAFPSILFILLGALL